MMQPPKDADVRVTPEAVALHLDLAGLGSRFIATFIDTLVQFALIAGLVSAAGPGLSALGAPDSVTVPLVIVVVTLIVLGYFPLLEILMHGRTIGKRAQRLRVVQEDGQPARAGAIIIRNLIRIVDYLPGWYVIGALTILLSKKSQRLGDMAANTIVVRERKVGSPGVLAVPEDASAGETVDATALTEREYAAVRAFLQRRAGLEPAARRHLAEKLAATLRPRVGGALANDPELLLESIARSYRARFTTES